ncbi:MAG: alpha-glucan family phosphorylase [Gammaproteobacteria bacterium]|nr:MAG: alpha-glucan family phosphorylase [Gammaproteobacteria bacterium]
MTASDHSLEVRARLPTELARLDELADNLLYGWDRRVRGLFFRMDPDLWRTCNHNPKVFLRRISQERLDGLARDREFLHQCRDVLGTFDAYLQSAPESRGGKIEGFEVNSETIAYFCMEYGLHESLQLYSGGLGILAGDLCKAASDLDLPFVAVGLMYRVGFFNQTLTRDGVQQIDYRPFNLADLPVRLVRDTDGSELQVQVELPGRMVALRIWRAAVGRIALYLLDSNVDANCPDDRRITYQLYGGDRCTRIEQEMVLGVGGVRALRAMDLAPTVWHVNEGHPALLILERCRERVAAGMDFGAAFEATAAATVFTTHTAVPAGHDLFPHDLAERHLMPTAEALGVPVAQLLALGESPQARDAFNMTALALRGSRQHNGVSAVHRDVAARMEAYVWPQIAPAENPLISVSNGVHTPTFLAREWVGLFDSRNPEWRRHLCDHDFWRETIEAIPDHRFWSLAQSLKSDVLDQFGAWLLAQYRRNNYTEARIEAMLRIFSLENTRPLIIGFARRFATYKRALLIFEDEERLGRILSDPQRPVILLFAGKAHPNDLPGQALIARLHQLAQQPPFRDRVFLLEGYDMALARKLVTGVDVWLNTPEYPMEASGTSGQKAAMNGVINLSVLDGWWAEGFDGGNGWGIAPHDGDVTAEERDRLEAEELLDLLEHEVVPSYFDMGPGGYSPDWVARSKRSMYTVLPRFNAERMLLDYAIRMYRPAAKLGRLLAADDGDTAQALARWKARVREAWSGVALDWSEPPPTMLEHGARARLRLRVRLNGLTAEDVAVECVLGFGEGACPARQAYRFRADTAVVDDAQTFSLDLLPPDNGLYRMQVRIYPHHELLQHPFEMGLMHWL